MEDVFSLPGESRFGPFCIVWGAVSNRNRILRVFLSDEHHSAGERAVMLFPHVKQGSCHEAEHLCVQISRFLRGEEIVFPLDTLMFEVCTTFQRDVLLAEYRIPRWWVSTYGKIASHLGRGGPRAVGTALARNPFPLVIPCHRAVRSDGALGGFQGGVAMKRALLEYEGIRFSPGNRVKTEKVYY